MHHPAPLGKHELIAIDYDMTGTSIHGHPMMALRKRLRGEGVKDSRDLGQLRNGTVVSVAGMVIVRQRPQTSNGTIFLLLEDEHGFINVIVSKRFVEPNEEIVKHAQFVLIRGRMEREGSAINVVGTEFEAIEAGEVSHQVAGFSLERVVKLVEMFLVFDDDLKGAFERREFTHAGFRHNDDRELLPVLRHRSAVREYETSGFSAKCAGEAFDRHIHTSASALESTGEHLTFARTAEIALECFIEGEPAECDALGGISLALRDDFDFECAARVHGHDECVPVDVNARSIPRVNAVV